MERRKWPSKNMKRTHTHFSSNRAPILTILRMKGLTRTQIADVFMAEIYGVKLSQTSRSDGRLMIGRSRADIDRRILRSRDDIARLA